MQLRAGYEIEYLCSRPTPMLLLLGVHRTRLADLKAPQRIALDPPIAAREYRDVYDNVCARVVAPAGRLTLSTDFIIRDPGVPDAVAPAARQLPVEELPDDVLVYLLGSRYCDTDHLATLAWSMFANAPTGWGRIRAICDYVHGQLTFGYRHASATRTAWEGLREQRGVCRDFARLAITLCRCMNIPARYCTGYLGDIGVPRAPEPMDFSAWFAAYLMDAGSHSTPATTRRASAAF
jgi:transglutaminase-like putative cysteine protease